MLVRRMRWLIDPRIQGRFIFVVSLVNFLGLAIFAVALKYYFYQFSAAAEVKGLPADHLFYQFLALQEKAMWQIFIGVAVISTAVSVIVSMVYSHRFVGPFKRLERALETYLASGRWEQLNFRARDYVKNLGDLLNRALQPKKD